MSAAQIAELLLSLFVPLDPRQSPPAIISADAFMKAIPRAIRAACDAIGLVRPSGIILPLDDARVSEISSNDIAVEAVHPTGLFSLESVTGLIGSVPVAWCPAGHPSIAVVATLRREFATEIDDGIRVFWQVNSVNVPPPESPGQLSLFV